MDENEINKNLENKKEVLDWMLKNNIKLVDDVGKVMSVYYKDPDFLLNVVKNNDNPDKILNY